ncbi:MAG: type II secretion system major pseudopilin GspG [Pseudomonadota bacterium]
MTSISDEGWAMNAPGGENSGVSEMGTKSRTQSRRAQGFSLIELLVALAIMALLVSLVAPRLFNQVDKSKIQAARAQAQSIKTSMNTLRLDIGRFPTADEGLSLLTEPPSDPAVASLWFGPYLDGDLPRDPWGNDYIYVAPTVDDAGRTTSPRVLSYGADAQPGGAGLNQDIGA